MWTVSIVFLEISSHPLSPGKILEHGSRGGGSCDILLGSSTVTMRVAPGNMMPTPVTQHDTHGKPTPGYHGDAARQFGIAAYSSPRIPTVGILSQVAEPGMLDTVTSSPWVIRIGAASSTAYDHLVQGNRQPMQAADNHNPGNDPTPIDPVPACTLTGVTLADAIGQAVKLTRMMGDSVADSLAPSR